MIGATAEAANRRSALRALVTIAPRASRIGDTSMIRVSSTVLASCDPSKPGVIARTKSVAQMNPASASTSSPASMRLMSVDTTRQARAESPFAMRPLTIGTTAEATAPAATSWKIRSGMRNAAKNASRSEPAPNVVPMTTTRT